MTIVLTTANAGGQPPRKLPAHITARPVHLTYIYLRLLARCEDERSHRRMRGESAHPITCRAWNVTDAGTYIFPPVAEYTI